MYRKLMIACLFTAIALTLGACQKTASTTEPAPTESMAAVTENQTETATQEKEEESTITGTLIDAAMSTLILKTDDGQEYIFSKENPDVSNLENGLVLGNRITLTYTGAIEGEDTTGVTVTAISDADPA